MDSIDKKWLASHQKTSHMSPALAPAGPAVDPQFVDLVKIDGGDSLSGDEIIPLYNGEPVASDVPHPLTKVLQQVEKERFHKTCGIADARWDTPLTKTSASKQRFENLIAKIFANHPDEREEALRIGRRAVNEERAAILASAAA